MKKMFIISIIIPTFIHASYNPFFNKTEKTEVPKQKESEAKIIIQKPKLDTKRTDIQASYFGFIESDKGKFALVKINGKNIVLKQKDSVYIGEKVVEVIDLTSNYIILKDGYNSPQTVYFSSKIPERDNVK